MPWPRLRALLSRDHFIFDSLTRSNDRARGETGDKAMLLPHTSQTLHVVHSHFQDGELVQPPWHRRTGGDHLRQLIHVTIHPLSTTFLYLTVLGAPTHTNTHTHTHTHTQTNITNPPCIRELWLILMYVQESAYYMYRQVSIIVSKVLQIQVYATITWYNV